LTGRFGAYGGVLVQSLMLIRRLAPKFPLNAVFTVEWVKRPYLGSNSEESGETSIEWELSVRAIEDKFRDCDGTADRIAEHSISTDT